ncbi:hypothetical protein ACFUTX_11195 [Microbacterium sp. NPDC057407]|uniref:hypothetical protein n=1 Tax=Microbacterium sp. NPDC057407 TaxID=3346120 RepID=UPI00366ADFA8
MTTVATGWRRRGAAVTAAAALLVGITAGALTACAPQGPGSAQPSPSATDLPEGVSAELQQGRSDVAARQAQVVIANATDETLVVGDLEVADPRFDGAIVRVNDRDSRIGPGRSVGVRVQLPAVACGDDVPSDDAAESVLTLAYVLGEVSGVATATVDDPLDFVGPLHERDCRAAAVADAANVTLSDFDPSPPGEPATLTMSVAPTGRGAVTITGIQTTNLLTFGTVSQTTVETWPLDEAVRPGDTGRVDIALPLLPLRCDPHAVQEDKRGTIFDVEVELDGEPGEFELAASEDLRGQILTWVADWCGFGG